MKQKLVVLVGLLFATTLGASAAADIYSYQEEFNDIVDIVTFGDVPEDSVEFSKLVNSVQSLYASLTLEENIKKKEDLLEEIQAVYLFLGEVAPGMKSYYMSIAQKRKALSVLGVEEEFVHDARTCLPIHQVKLFNETYTCYFIDNKSDSLMTVFKIGFVGQTKHTTISGSIEAGVTRGCSKCILEIKNDVKEVKFSGENCEQEIQVTAYVQPEIIQPKVETYAEPDYYSPKEKQAMKKKKKEQLKKEKAKAKKQAIKAKKRKKKAMMKQREETRKAQLKARQQKAKEVKDAREAAQKEKARRAKEKAEAKKK